MLNDNLEKHFKENIESSRFSWDKEDMWADIEKELPPEKKKRVVYWYWLAAAAMVLLLIGFFFSDYTNNDQNITINKPVVSNESIDKNETILSTKENDITDITPNNETITSTVKPATEVQLTNSIDQLKTKDSKIISTKKSSNNISTTNNTQIINSELKIDNNIQLAPIITKEIVENSNNIAESIPRTEMDAIQIEVTKINQLNLNNELITNELDLDDLTTIIPVKKKCNHPLSIGAYGLLGTINRTLTANEGESPELLNLRNEEESTLETFGAGIFVRKYINNKLFFQGGIEYTVINEKLEYTEELIELTTVESDTAYNYQSYTGIKQYKSGIVEAEKITSTNYTRYNEHSFLNMPIYIGYRIPLKKISLTAALGPVFTLNQTYTGYAYQDDQSISISISISNNKPFISNSSLYSIDGLVEGSINLKNNVKMFMGVHYRKGMNGFSINKGITQKYDLLSGRVGIKLNL